MVIKSCPLLMKDTETCVGSSLASYFVLFSLISFCFRWFRFHFVDFVSFLLISFRFVSFLLISFRFVSFRFVSFRFVFVDFVSFRFYFVSHFIVTLIFHMVLSDSLVIKYLFECNLIIYHIFRLKYRCFVYALSMIVPNLYRVYPISHTLYRIPYIVYPKNFKIS
jgi:hypothetical protein